MRLARPQIRIQDKESSVPLGDKYFLKMGHEHEDGCVSITGGSLIARKLTLPGASLAIDVPPLQRSAHNLQVENILGNSFPAI